MDTAARPLSPRQRELCQVVHELAGRMGYPPSMEECARVLGVCRVHALRLAHGAVRRGALAHTPGCTRSWRVVDLEAVTGKAARTATSKRG
jgi:SOS-response transcriptional repressor LexA